MSKSKQTKTENKALLASINLNEIKFKNNEVICCGFGGLDEVGSNMTIYGYKGSWLIVDMGVGYNAQSHLGLDIFIVNPEALMSIKRNLKAIILTHAHDDHIAAIQHVWQKVKLPIYTSNYTYQVLIRKLKDNNCKFAPKINIIDENSKLQLDHFNLNFVQLNHTVPENLGSIINMGDINVFHTSDWSLAKKNGKIHVPNFPTQKSLAKLKRAENLVIFGDSTNANEKGINPSEDTIFDNLLELIQSSEKRVFVSLFSSNIERLINLLKIAKLTKRIPVFAGKSIMRNWESATTAGIIPANIPKPVDCKLLKKKSQQNMLVICTGCQGEKMSAMNLLSSNSYPFLNIEAGENVIFSSSIIPGNELAVGAIQNNLAKIGAKVFQEENLFHVSGHAKASEIEWLYKQIKPKLVIPAHGEIRHRLSNSLIAKKIGAKACLISNFEVLAIEQDLTQRILGKVESPLLTLDGKKVLLHNHISIKQRKSMAYNGHAVVNFNIDSRNCVEVKSIILSVIGLDSSDDVNYDRIHNSVIKYINTYDLHEFEPYKVAEIFKNAIRKACLQIFGKKPIVTVHIRRGRTKYVFNDFSNQPN